MNKLFLLLLFIIFTLHSCSPSVNIPLFAKSDNAKELILSKYGNPSKVENQLGKEKWTYNYSSKFKSNRTVIFDSSDKIRTNKKHYKPFHMITGLNKYGYISVGIIFSLRIIFGPFPALL